MHLYPLKFQPIYKYRIWGGNKLKTCLNKDYSEDSIGESWEISGVEGNVSLVCNGDLKGRSLKELIQTYEGDLVGHKIYETFGDDFPILIKFIDTKTPLSIQVHPNNALAKVRHNSFGKNEMWYIMEADKNAELIIGFNQKVSPKIYKEKLENEKILDILNVEKISKGDTFYIPTGRVHAIGGGVLLAEIQQTSDITYRIYDYNRVDAKTGKTRELHSDMALDAIDFEFHKDLKTHYTETVNVPSTLVHSTFFKTNIVIIEGTLEMDYEYLDSFVIYICVEGHVELECNGAFFHLKKGETMLVPSAINHLKIKATHAKILEVSI